MTIKIEILELSRGLNPSRWKWIVELNQGGRIATSSHGIAETMEEATKEATGSARALINDTTPLREGEKVIVTDRGEERWAKVVGFSREGVFVKFDAEPSIGAWAYNRSSIRRRDA